MKLGMFLGGAASGAAQGYMMKKMADKADAKAPVTDGVMTPNTATAEQPDAGATGAPANGAKPKILNNTNGTVKLGEIEANLAQYKKFWENGNQGMGD